MKNRKRLTAASLILLTVILAAALIQINRDLYHFSYDTLLQREFIPEREVKRDYILTAPITLKPGSYTLAPELTVQGYGSGVFLVDGDEDAFFSADLPMDCVNPTFPFEISGTSKQVRFGIRYNPALSTIRMERLRITADHVLTRDSLLRHAAISALIILLGCVTALRICKPSVLWKLFPAFSRRENEWALLLLLGLTAAACYPLFDSASYVRGEDMFFHLTRIQGLSDSLRAGYFPVRNQLYWLHNYGYGVGFYYPDVFLYFPACLVLLGFELLTAYKVFLILCSFFSIASVWYAGLRISKDRSAAAAAAVFMAFAAYRLSNVYYRGAVGETQAAMFYPLIILGLYEIFEGNRERWLLFAFGFLGLFCCHMISLAIGVLLTALFLLTRLRRIHREPQILIVLLKSVLLVLGIGAFFWLPMLEQSLTNPGLRINNVLSGDVVLNGTNYAFPVQNLFSRFKAWNFAFQADCVYPGWSLLLIPLLALAVWKNRGRTVRVADFLLIFSLPVLWMCTRAFPWEWKVFLPFVTRIQFAYRLLLSASVMLCLSGGIYISVLCRKKSAVIPLCVLVLFCFFSTAFPVLQESVKNRTVSKRLFVMQDNRVSGGEYMPLGLESDFPSKNADTVFLAESDLQLTITAHKRQRLDFSFDYELPEESGIVNFSLPLIFYTGYRGTLTTPDGTVINSEITPDAQGLVSLDNAGYPIGSVNVTWQKTVAQYIGEGITILSLCVFLFTNCSKPSIWDSGAGRKCPKPGTHFTRCHLSH